MVRDGGCVGGGEEEIWRERGGEIACGLAHIIIAAYGICVWQLQSKIPKKKWEKEKIHLLLRWSGGTVKLM